MATEVLRAHDVILPQHRVRAGHQKPSPAARKAAAAGRKHQGGRKAAVLARGPTAAEVYAGPAFSTSPEPSLLPLPQFPVKKAAAVAVVDDAATRNLRRILRL